MQQPAARQEEWALPASELVEPEVLEASDPVLPAAEDGEDTAAVLVLLGRPLLLLWMLISGKSVAARRGWSHLPLLILNLPALTLGVEGSINQLVETVKAVVQQRILDVIIQPFLEILLLVAITGDVSRGIAGKLKETVTVLRHRHRSLK
jgi:hypothetical protein